MVRKLFFAIVLAILGAMAALIFSNQQLMLSTQQPKPISELYIFGDSLSDMGQVFRTTGGAYPPSPPYFQGRYSNGRVWVEYLADRLDLGTQQIHNFAYGGATSGNIAGNQNFNVFSIGSVPSLVTQVNTFTQSQSSFDPATLYILWAGANDYLQGVTSATASIDNLTRAILTLANSGAQRILVGNLPDLGQLPATRNSANSAQLSALTQTHNQGLRRSLKQLQQQRSNLQIATLDANVLYREAILNPAAFGLTNVLTACLAGSGACPDPAQSLFWDGIHPTTAAHQILGKAAFSAIQAAGLVNPASAVRP